MLAPNYDLPFGRRPLPRAGHDQPCNNYPIAGGVRGGQRTMTVAVRGGRPREAHDLPQPVACARWLLHEVPGRATARKGNGRGLGLLLVTRDDD